MSGITTATDVAEMYERLQDAENKLDITERKFAVVTQEKETLQARLTVMSRERDEELIRSTTMRVLIEHVSMGLVTGLQKMREDETTRKSLRREQQEDELGVTGRAPPARQPAPVQRAPIPLDDDRPPIVKRVLPRPAPSPAPLQSRDQAPAFLRRPEPAIGMQEPDLDDPRLPKVEEYSGGALMTRDDDETSLLALANQIGGGSRR